MAETLQVGVLAMILVVWELVLVLVAMQKVTGVEVRLAFDQLRVLEES